MPLMKSPNRRAGLIDATLSASTAVETMLIKRIGFTIRIGCVATIFAACLPGCSSDESTAVAPDAVGQVTRAPKTSPTDRKPENRVFPGDKVDAAFPGAEQDNAASLAADGTTASGRDDGLNPESDFPDVAGARDDKHSPDDESEFDELTADFLRDGASADEDPFAPDRRRGSFLSISPWLGGRSNSLAGADVTPDAPRLYGPTNAFPSQGGGGSDSGKGGSGSGPSSPDDFSGTDPESGDPQSPFGAMGDDFGLMPSSESPKSTGNNFPVGESGTRSDYSMTPSDFPTDDLADVFNSYGGLNPTDIPTGMPEEGVDRVPKTGPGF